MALCINPSRIPLPKGWPQHLKTGFQHVVSLAHYAAAYTRAAGQPTAGMLDFGSGLKTINSGNS